MCSWLGNCQIRNKAFIMIKLDFYTIVNPLAKYSSPAYFLRSWTIGSSFRGSELHRDGGSQRMSEDLLKNLRMKILISSKCFCQSSRISKLLDECQSKKLHFTSESTMKQSLGRFAYPTRMSWVTLFSMLLYLYFEILGAAWRITEVLPFATNGGMSPPSRTLLDNCAHIWSFILFIYFVQFHNGHEKILIDLAKHIPNLKLRGSIMQESGCFSTGLHWYCNRLSISSNGSKKLRDVMHVVEKISVT